jgi:agmatinase
MNFGGLEAAFSDFENSKVLVWPVPYEKTESFRKGAGLGPSAIIEASRHVETYDDEIGGETAVAIGIHTLPAMRADYSPEEMFTVLQKETGKLLKSGKFLCTLGGEHSITAPIVVAHQKAFPNLSVLQIDAHTDIKKSYMGSEYGHASVMRHVLKVCPAVQVGIRSLSADEARAIPHLPTNVFYAKDIVGSGSRDWVESAVSLLTDEVYLTIDVDGLDPSVIREAGNPVPGGLSWDDVLAMIETLAINRRVVGMDVVELCGGPEDQPSSVAVATLVYKALGYIFRDQIPPLDLDAPDQGEEVLTERAAEAARAKEDKRVAAMAVPT